MSRREPVSDQSAQVCRIDTQPNHWFQCTLGTVGCPRIHNGRTPHCIACVAGEPCPYHSEPVVEMAAKDYYAAASDEERPASGQCDTWIDTDAHAPREEQSS